MTRGRKIAYAVVTQLLLLGLVEAGLRVAGLPRATRASSPLEFVGVPIGGGEFPLEWDDALFWRLVPNARVPGHDERVNAQGCRGADFAAAKPADARRVLCFGDSNVFGMGVERGETFSARLGEWLRGAPQRFEVLNLGVPGYSAFQIARCLERKGVPLAPDFVVVYPGAWNDYVPAIGENDAAIAARLDRSGAWISGVDALPLRSLALARSLFRRAPPTQRASVGGTLLQNFAEKHELPNGPRVPLEMFRDRLRAVSRDARAAGARAIFVVPAASRATRAKFPESDAYAQAIRDVATESGDPLVDSRAELDRPDDEGVVLYADSVHPSACGHAWIAAGVAAAMRSLAPELASLDPSRLRDPIPIDLSARIADAAARAASGPAESGGLVRRFPLHASAAVASPSRLELDAIEIPERAELQTWMAIVSPWVKQGAVRFRVLADDAELFSEEMLPSPDEPLRIRERRVPLAAFAGKTVRLTFAVDGDTPAVAWIRPQIRATK